MDDVGQPVRRNRILALDVLEEKVVSDQFDILGCLYSSRGLQHLRHHFICGFYA